MQLLACQQLQAAAPRRRSTRPVRAPALAAQRCRPARGRIRSSSAAAGRQFSAGVLASRPHHVGPEFARCRPRAAAWAAERSPPRESCMRRYDIDFSDRASATADFSPATVSLRGLDWVNFFLAGALAGFGPYVAVYLADQKWTQEKVGFVFTASALAGLLSQVPGGELLDTTRSKRVIVALGVIVVAISAMIIEFRPDFSLVLIGLVLQGGHGGH